MDVANISFLLLTITNSWISNTRVPPKRAVSTTKLKHESKRKNQVSWSKVQRKKRTAKTESETKNNQNRKFQFSKLEFQFNCAVWVYHWKSMRMQQATHCVTVTVNIASVWVRALLLCGVSFSVLVKLLETKFIISNFVGIWLQEFNWGKKKATHKLEQLTKPTQFFLCGFGERKEY